MVIMLVVVVVPEETTIMVDQHHRQDMVVLEDLVEVDQVLVQEVEAIQEHQHHMLLR